MKTAIKLEINITDPTLPYIWSVFGQVTVDTLGMIECDLDEWVQGQHFAPELETVTVLADYVEPEYHEGRVAIAGYWDLTVVSTDTTADAVPFETVAAEVESHGWAWTCRKTRDTAVEQEEHGGLYIARIWTVLGPQAPGVHYLGIEYGPTPARALATVLSKVKESAEAFA